jgi:regulator of sirC expression with transglutaminase-like and TPR domain
MPIVLIHDDSWCPFDPENHLVIMSESDLKRLACGYDSLEDILDLDPVDIRDLMNRALIELRLKGSSVSVVEEIQDFLQELD